MWKTCLQSERVGEEEEVGGKVREGEEVGEERQWER